MRGQLNGRDAGERDLGMTAIDSLGSFEAFVPLFRALEEGLIPHGACVKDAFCRNRAASRGNPAGLTVSSHSIRICFGPTKGLIFRVDKIRYG